MPITSGGGDLVAGVRNGVGNEQLVPTPGERRTSTGAQSASNAFGAYAPLWMVIGKPGQVFLALERVSLKEIPVSWWRYLCHLGMLGKLSCQQVSTEQRCATIGLVVRGPPRKKVLQLRAQVYAPKAGLGIQRTSTRKVLWGDTGEMTQGWLKRPKGTIYRYIEREFCFLFFVPFLDDSIGWCALPRVKIVQSPELKRAARAVGPLRPESPQLLVSLGVWGIRTALLHIFFSKIFFSSSLTINWGA